MSSAKLIKSHVSSEQIRRVLFAFFGSKDDCEWTLIDQGNINDTFLARNDQGSFIVQRINGAVFPNPEQVAENTALVSLHICRTQNKARTAAFPQIFPTSSGQNFYKDKNGTIWRAQKYIKKTISYERVESSRQAVEIGRCLGRFHKMVQDLPPSALTQSLPGFHNLPRYMSRFNSAWSAFSAYSSDELLFCLEVINENKRYINFFEDAVLSGNLQLTVTHGDPKVANILFDMNSEKALTLIDLDTVGPGLILQDLGDCLRSCCSRTGEDDYTAANECDSTYVAQVVTGYLEENELSTFEKEHLYKALYLITFELGVRFVTDHLEGNHYFKVQNRDDNLHRALVQFRLVRSIKEQQKVLRSMIDSAIRSKKS